MCNTSDTCISLMDYETIKTKQKLCEEQLQVMNIIDPGLSVARGKLLVELQQTKLKIGKVWIWSYFWLLKLELNGTFGIWWNVIHIYILQIYS